MLRKTRTVCISVGGVVSSVAAIRATAEIIRATATIAVNTASSLYRRNAGREF
jgi:hypothetical protein